MTITPIWGIRQISGTSQTCTGCGGTSTDSYTFDANRNPTSYKDFNGNLTCYSYSPRNLELSRTEGLSGAGTCAARVATTATRTITTEWHPTWRLKARTAEPLRMTSYRYHGDAGISCAPSGSATSLLCAKEVQATTDGDGAMGFAATADGAPRTWSYSYDAQGRVLSIDGPRTDVADTTTFTYYATATGDYRTGDLARARSCCCHLSPYRSRGFSA